MWLKRSPRLQRQKFKCIVREEKKIILQKYTDNDKLNICHVQHLWPKLFPPILYWIRESFGAIPVLTSSMKLKISNIHWIYAQVVISGTLMNLNCFCCYATEYLESIATDVCYNKWMTGHFYQHMNQSIRHDIIHYTNVHVYICQFR